MTPRLLHPSQLPATAMWADQALCAQADPELWYPDKGGNSRAAVAICRTCPVIAECLESALAYERTTLLSNGIWGGQTVRQRRLMLRGLPGLCALCPNEREPKNTYCVRCQEARRVETLAKYASDETWRDRAARRDEGATA